MHQWYARKITQIRTNFHLLLHVKQKPQMNNHWAQMNLLQVQMYVMVSKSDTPSPR
jgi:hypothetical protein